jgi:hypothetical protein
MPKRKTAPRKCRRHAASVSRLQQRCVANRSRLGWLFAIAVLPRSEQPTAARTPKPRSVKLRPLRTVLPMPSYGTQRTSDVSTPRYKIRSSSSCPIGFFCECCNYSGAHAKPPESARTVVFFAPLPSLKVSGRTDALFAGIEAQHYLAEADSPSCNFQLLSK